MTTHDFDQPYMIYEGELPRHLQRKLNLTNQAQAEDEDGFDWSSLWIIGVVLAFGIVIGVCGTLTLRSIGPRPTQAAPTSVPDPQLQQDVFASVPRAPDKAAPTIVEPPLAAPPPVLPAMMAGPRVASERTAPIHPATMLVARAATVARSSPRSATPLGALSGCDAAPTRADRAICANPALAAADQDMRRAYQRALDAGAPPMPLRASQEDWLIASEVAADRSTLDLAAAYSRRIAELNAMARREPPH